MATNRWPTFGIYQPLHGGKNRVASTQHKNHLAYWFVWYKQVHCQGHGFLILLVEVALQVLPQICSVDAISALKKKKNFWLWAKRVEKKLKTSIWKTITSTASQKQKSYFRKTILQQLPTVLKNTEFHGYKGKLRKKFPWYMWWDILRKFEMCICVS